MTLCILDADLNVLRFVASIGDGITEDSEQVVSLPEQGRNERATLLKNGEMVRIINQPDKKLGTKEIQERLGFNPNVSILAMVLRLEGNLIGNLGLVADGLDRYNDEHARLLRLLHEPFAIAMSNALKHKEIIRFKDMLADDNRYLHGQLRELSGDQIIGSQCGLKGVMEKVNQVATLDSPVLLLGETGVGKEVIADAIHYSSHRKDGPFIKVNCGAIPETLFDSELFGHEKGAFTGAISQKRGRFERADKGTIFLDEIGELPLQAQVRLLHVLQDRKVERVGGTNPVPLDIRIISATNRNLEEMIALGRFREDLWFRFNVFPIMIPPLRQRKQDIPELVHHFIERKSMEFKLRERPIIPAGVIDRLMAYDWPGNVRELGNMIERAMIQHRGGNLSFETLLAPPAPKSRGADPDAGRNRPLLSLEEVNIRHIRQALERAGGKINGPGGAAQILGIHPNTLRKRMNSLGIAYGRKTWQHFIQSVQSSRTSE
jgi:transcriptional regulator with GAF, ATPase, and Fis domain